MLITDHNVREAFGIIDRTYIIYKGLVMAEGSPDEVVSDSNVGSVYSGERFAY